MIVLDTPVALPRRSLYLSGPEDDGDIEEPAMKFRLTYEGSLRPTQRDPERNQSDRLAAHKQAIRRNFHQQLRTLWCTNKFLSTHLVHPTGLGSLASDTKVRRAIAEVSDNLSVRRESLKLLDVVASQYHRLGYRFVPLAREDMSLLCSLDILFLRADAPTGVIYAGDIDNRIKTLIDALRLPKVQTELVDDDKSPREDEDPFFCLLEDDKQVTRLVVETDALLQRPAQTQEDSDKVALVITVELRPYDINAFNLNFS